MSIPPGDADTSRLLTTHRNTTGKKYPKHYGVVTQRRGGASDWLDRDKGDPKTTLSELISEPHQSIKIGH